MNSNKNHNNKDKDASTNSRNSLDLYDNVSNNMNNDNMTDETKNSSSASLLQLDLSNANQNNSIVIPSDTGGNSVLIVNPNTLSINNNESNGGGGSGGGGGAKNAEATTPTNSIGGSRQIVPNTLEYLVKVASYDKLSSKSAMRKKTGVELLLTRINSLFLFLIIPLFLLICIILKLSFQSIIYMILLFFLPFLYPINQNSIAQRFRKYLILLIVVSTLGLLGQLTFQIVLLSNMPYANEDILPNCSFTQELLEEFGYSRFDTAYISDIFRIIMPEVLLLLVASFNYFLCSKVHKINVAIKRENVYKDNKLSNTKDTTFTDHFVPLKNVSTNEGKQFKSPEITVTLATPTSPTRSNDLPGTSTSFAQQQPLDPDKLSVNKQTSISSTRKLSASTLRKTPIERFINTLFPILSELTFLCLLFTCACLWPSLLSVPYFVLFILIFIKWSFSSDLNRFQAPIKIFLLIHLPLHMLAYYLYQLKMFQMFLPSNDLPARLLGLSNIVYSRCEQPGHFFINDQIKWQQIVLPFALFILYWFIALEFSYFSEKMNFNNNSKATQEPYLIKKPTGVISTPTSPVSQAPKLSKIDEDSNDDQASKTDPNEQLIEKQRLFTPENFEPDKVSYLKLDRIKMGNSVSFSSLNDNESPAYKMRRRQTAYFIEQTRIYLYSIFKFLTKQSYLLSLISMMAWSILYHSILTLVLLIWACLIWVLPNSRIWCLRSSPLFVIYCVFLLICEFIYGLQLNENELPQFTQVGLKRHEVPYIHLFVKNTLLLSLWLTLRQYITEKRKKIKKISSDSTSSDVNSFLAGQMQSKIVDWIYSCLVKYWIFLSSATLLLMSCQSGVVAYRIGYMVLFLYFITTFQLINTFWRKTLYIFHLIVIIYSMIVLFVIYIFQFDEVPAYFKRIFNIDDMVLSSLGFQKFDKKDELIERLLTPTTFLIVNILQIHYFNKPWLSLTDIKNIKPHVYGFGITTPAKDNPTTSTNDVHFTLNEKKDPTSQLIEKIKTYWQQFYTVFTFYLWRAAELHVYHVVMISIALFCFKRIDLLNLLLIVSVIFSFLVDRSRTNKNYRSIFCGLVQLWVTLLTMCSMIYQLEFIKSPLETNCTFTNQTIGRIDPFLLKEEDNLVYIGLSKSDDIQSYLNPYIVIFLLLTFQKIVKLKQKYVRKQLNIGLPAYSIIFEDVTYKNMDTGTINFLKYLANYFYYRFGLEICLFMATITVIVRMDAYAVIHCVWLGVFLTCKRETISRLWTAYLLFLSFLLPIQYISCVGLPPVLCYEYPWTRSINHRFIFEKLRLWLYLSDYSNPPNAHYMIADFFQLFFVWLQYSVFQIEYDLANSKNDKKASPHSSCDEHDNLEQQNDQQAEPTFEELAGSNRELVYQRDPYANNPFHDFVSDTTTFLDKIKYLVYMYSYWLVLAIVFLTGTSRISILCFGYVILSFFFLWYGQTFLMKPLEKLLKHWNVIVFYCFVVIFVKACLQIILCLITNQETTCVLIDVFGINCRANAKAIDANTTCSRQGESDDVGLVWDCICFLVLLLQRRLYMSFMFEHVVNEYKAQSTLAARGAEIFKEIIYYKVEIERQKEAKTLEKLKDNVERIRKHQVKEWNQEPQEHYEAIRSGDYYMFDDEFEIDETGLTDLDDTITDMTPQGKGRKRLRKKVSKDISLSTKSSFSKQVKPIDSDTEPKNRKKSSVKATNATAENVKSSTEDELDSNNEQQDEKVNNTGENKENSNWYTIENKTILMIFFFIKKYTFVLIDFIIDYLNRHAKDFRHVSHILTKEKLILKKEFGNIQTPNIVALMSTQLRLNEEQKQHQDALHKFLQEKNDKASIIAASHEVDDEIKSQSRLNRFLSALIYFLLSQTDKICYFFMILDHLKSASLLSVPLPISVFLWAMLCIPRPTKTYWITCITYVEIIVVIKYIFQFKIYPWNSSERAILNTGLNRAITMLGIQTTRNFALFDLFVLLVIFSHRLILKRLGLWRDYSKEDELLLTKKIDDNNSNGSKRLAVAYITDNVDGNACSKKNTEQSTDNNQIQNENSLIDTSPADQIQTLTIVQNEDSDFEEILNSDDSQEIFLIKPPKKNRFIKFYQELGSKHYAVVVDCYAKMFMCDFINCIVIVFTYQWFGETARAAASSNTSSSVVSSIKDNKVPYPFLVLFLIQFILMIIDRALYLRKNRQGKFIFQLFLVILIHVYIFFILPFITKINFIDNTPAQFCYFIKCIYFGFSSHQIRCGYPTRILGNFLTKSYTYVNLVLFKGFLIVPFLLELRSLMDWMFTDTSLGLSDWLQVEDIYANIFVLKCFRYNEHKYPTPRGQKRKAIIKYGFGGLLLIVIVLVIWFPLLLFSFSEGFNRTVPPTSCQVNVQLAGFLPIYSMTSQGRLMKPLNSGQLNNLKTAAPESSYTFLKDFNPEDIYCILIPGQSTSLWQISPPSIDNLKYQLKNMDDVDLEFSYTITRESSEEQNEQLSEIISGTRLSRLTNETDEVLYRILMNEAGQTNVTIPLMYPRFVHARAKGNLLEIDSLKTKDDFPYYVDVTVTLKNQSNELWWNLNDVNDKEIDKFCPSPPGSLSIILFSDKVSPKSLSFLTEHGIIGIYITFVFALSRFIRIMVVNSSMRIMFEQMPDVDRILKLLHSIYLVRENKKYYLEEEIYSKILFLYRSPETIIKYTKPRQYNKKYI